MRWLVPIAGAAAAAALVLAIWPGAGIQESAPVSSIRPSSAPKEAAERAPAAAPPAAPAETAPGTVDKNAESARGAALDSLSAGARARAKSDDERRAVEEKTRNLRRAEKQADSPLRESQERQQQVGAADARQNAVALQKPAPANESAQVQNFGRLQNQAQNQNQSQNSNQAPSQAQTPARLPSAPPPPAAAPPAPATAPAAVVAGQAGRPAGAEQAKTEGVMVTSRRDFRSTLPTIIATPDATVIWRIVNGRDVQRSSDSGTTWTLQTTVPDAQLTAGACPTATACWLVGSGGTVLRTTDGLTWTRVLFLDNRDLLLVTSSSADSAVVTGSDSRKVGTSDGGKTWIQEK